MEFFPFFNGPLKSKFVFVATREHKEILKAIPKFYQFFFFFSNSGRPQIDKLKY